MECQKVSRNIFFFLILTLCSIQSTFANSNDLTVAMNITGSGAGPTSKRQETAHLFIDITPGSNNNTQMTLNVTVAIPHDANSNSNCRNFYNGTQISCDSAVITRCAKAKVDMPAVEVKLGNTLYTGPSLIPGRLSVTIENSNASCSSTPENRPYFMTFTFPNYRSNQDSVLIKIPFGFPKAVPLVGTAINFEQTVTYNGSDTATNKSITLTGEQLQCSGSTNISSVEAGDFVKVTFDIQHSSSSTATAKAATAKLRLSGIPAKGYKCVKADVTLPNTTVLSMIDASTLIVPGVFLGNISKTLVTQTAKVELFCEISDTVQINTIAVFTLDVTYSGYDLTTGRVTLPTKSLSITSVNCNIPNSLIPTNRHACNIQATLPKGEATISEVFVGPEGPGGEHVVRVPTPSITSPGNVLHTPPSSSRGRNKRAATITFTVNEPLGTLSNPAATGTSGANIGINSNVIVNQVSAPVSGTLYVYLNINNNNVYLISQTITLTRPYLKVVKKVEIDDAQVRPQTVKFMVNVTHDPSSTVTANNVVLSDGLEGFSLYLPKGYTPPGQLSQLSGDVVYNRGNMAVNDVALMSYIAGPAGNEVTQFKEGNTNMPVRVTYEMSFTDSSGNPQKVNFVQIASVCVSRDEEVQTSAANEYGLVILVAFFGVLAGAIVAVVIIILIVCVCMKGRRSEVAPATREEEMKEIQSRMKTVMTDHKEAMKKTGNLIKDYSLIGVDESIIFILTMKDKLGIHRELDNLDILSTIHIDQNLENERNNATVEASALTVRGLCQNGDVAPEVEARSLGLFMKTLGEMDKRLEADYRKELKNILKKLANKNKAKLAELLGLQHQEKLKTQQKIEELPEENQKELMELLHQKHQTEQNELAYRLKLEQDEETENLRKEFAVRRRMGIKDAQQHFLGEVVHSAQLNPEQADWLMKEHAKNQAKLETLYDEEISRQRMILEEKLARRKQLANETEMQEEDHSALLNTMAGQQLGVIKAAKKEGAITKAEMEEMIRKLKEDMLKLKDKLETERQNQEAQLHKKLSARKKAKLEAKQREHANQLHTLEAKQSKTAQTDSQVDPMIYLESRMTMLSLHRQELSDLENAVDKEHAAELKKLRDGFTDATKEELETNKTKLIEKLREEGLTEAQMTKLLRQHEKELLSLKTAQEEERQIQHDNFKRRLSKNRKNWEKRKLEEKQEQEQLRNHEGNVVRNIIDNQMSMSDAERERILKEHEKQMVKLENSLTLNKLRQKRMLEEKLAKKRTQQMEKLEKKQINESKEEEDEVMFRKMKRRQADEDSEEEDEDEKKQQEQINLMKKHAEQKIAILHGDKLKLEDELEEIRTEMMQERALALKEQEERLAGMLASLQLEKAKEMAKIEEQQKAINSLKSNLMDDLTDKGVLSSPECQKVIEIHQKEKEKLNKKLDAQKAKQEKNLLEAITKRNKSREDWLRFEHKLQLEQDEVEDANEILRERLAERLEQKEQALKDMHENELKEVLGSTKSKAASKIKRVSVMHKHMVEMEQFRNRMEKEMNQTIEDVRREHEVYRSKAIQERELQFIAGLIRLGAFQKEELLDVLRMLFPLRQEAEIAELFTRIYDEEAIKQNPRKPSKAHSLAERIRAATNATFDESLPKLSRRRKSQKTNPRANLVDSMLGKQTRGETNLNDTLLGNPREPLLDIQRRKKSIKAQPKGRESISEPPNRRRSRISSISVKNNLQKSILENESQESDSYADNSYSNPRYDSYGRNLADSDSDQEKFTSRVKSRNLPPIRSAPKVRNADFM